MNISENIKKDLEKFASPVKAKASLWFFKTGKGEYGEGDQFIGVTLPEQKTVVKKYYKDASLSDVETLLKSPIHEHRLVALSILTLKYPKATDEEKKIYYNFYLGHLDSVNNWDLVDLSAHKIMGEYLLDKDRSIVYKLSKSNDLWRQRVSILTTFRFIKDGDFKDALRLAEYFLTSDRDLIHKATGWMLKEIGKRDEKVLTDFLDKHYKQMPRTMLRYCIEKLSESQRKHYMAK